MPFKDQITDSAKTDIPVEVAAAYYQVTGRMASRGMRIMAERGDLASCAPLGYLNRREGRRACVVIDPMQGALVREAFEMAADGFSLAKILKALGAKGLRSRNGKTLGPSSLRLVLRNPFYAGNIRFGGLEMRGNHKASVSAELFDRAQKALETRRKNKR